MKSPVSNIGIETKAFTRSLKRAQSFLSWTTSPHASVEVSLIDLWPRLDLWSRLDLWPRLDLFPIFRLLNKKL